MKWVLIYFVIAYNNNGISTNYVQFDSEKSCKDAANALMQQFPPDVAVSYNNRMGVRAWAMCQPV